jgi:hypothetical protein
MAQFFFNKKFFNSLLINSNYSVTNLKYIYYRQYVTTTTFKKQIYITTPIFYVNASEAVNLFFLL